MVRYAVTGADGFVGGQVCRHLESHSLPFSGYDFRSHHSPWENQHPLQLLEILESGDTDQLPSFVFHIGANSNAQAKHYRDVVAPNTNYTEQLGRLCALRNISLVFTSSASIYGREEDHKIPPIQALSPYARSKYISEKTLTNLARVEGLNLRILRLYNVYGTTESKKGAMASIPSQFVESALKSQRIEIWDARTISSNSGWQARDFIHVSDVVNLLMNAFEDNRLLTDIGSGCATSFYDIAKYIQELVPCKIEIRPLPKNVNPLFYQTYTRASTSHMHKFLKEDSLVPLQEGLVDLVNYFRKNDTGVIR